MRADDEDAPALRRSAFIALHHRDLGAHGLVHGGAQLIADQLEALLHAVIPGRGIDDLPPVPHLHAGGEPQRRGEQAQSKCNPYFHESFLSRSATPSRPGDGTPDCGRSRPVRYESLHPDSRRHWIIPFRDFGSRRARATQSSQQAAKTTNVPAKHFAFSPSTGKRKTVRTRPTRMWTK